ncbi:MAG: hypothetical protein Q8K18_00180 [Burkholderiales bacterium]|nr:hypothetical protein [Burkholderiales bacterium]
MKNIWIVLVLVAGCASSGGLFGETVGEKFRKALANVDAVCRERKIGPYLDPNDPEYRRKSSLMNCEILKIKPFDLNAVLATPEGKFAYSLQLPPPLDKPRVKRSDYRSGEEYFQALCEKEVGDHVFDRQINVDGIAQLRLPMPKYVKDSLGSYSDESTGTSYLAVHANPPGHLVVREARLYKFMEIVTAFSSDGVPLTITRYVRDEQAPSPTALRSEMTDRFNARYGYLWRGTPQFDSRSEGIGGGELIVLEVASKRILGVRRMFFRDDVDLSVTDRVRWSSRRCRGIKNEGLHFVVDLLKPAN